MATPAFPAPDQLFDFVTEIGAAATAIGVAVGGLFAAHYGKRASTSVSATASETPNGIMMVVRPVIKAVGIFRVHFEEGRGSYISVQEMIFDGEGVLVPRGDPVRTEGFFDGQFVEAGEELTTSVLFSQVPCSDSTVGWQVFLRVGSPLRWSRLRRTENPWWNDRVFVSNQWPPS